MELSLRALLESRVARFPEKVFLIFEKTGRRFSYREFDQRANQIANLLRSLGVEKGDKVSLLLSNCAEYALSYFACWKIGAVAGPVNALLKAHEIGYVIGHSEASVLVTEASYWPHIEQVHAGLPLLEEIVLLDAIIEGTVHYPTEVERQSLELGPIDIDPTDDAIIIYTSGTTGQPKGALLTQRNLLANARQIADWLKFDAADRFLCTMPLFHMNAVAVTTLTPLYVGGSVVLAPKFSATRHWKMISDYGVTTFGSVATMLSMLLSAYPDGIPSDCDTSRLKFALCGSAPVPVPVMQQFEERFKCPVIEGYGLTESTCRSTFNPPDGRRRLGSVGLPIGNEMKIFDDLDNELLPGQLGEIVLRGENIMKAYFKNPEATADAFRAGWFHTGDVGYMDEDGFFYVVDRKSDMIIRGGENIYPREIDEVLYLHPAVKDAATVGVADELYGEEVRAYVVLKEGAACRESDLIEFCRSRLADYKCPKTVEFLTEIPKGATGKLLKRALSGRAAPRR
jgi:long-chain acyl-CoA synthetase